MSYPISSCEASAALHSLYTPKGEEKKKKKGKWGDGEKKVKFKKIGPSNVTKKILTLNTAKLY